MYGGGVISPFQRLRVKNMSVKIGLIELTEPSDTLNYKPFFKHCILQTILHEFLLFIFVWKIYFVLRTESYFTFFFFIWFEVAFGSTVLKVLCFKSSLYKVIGNHRIFSYNRCNFVGIAINTVLSETSTNTYFQNYLMHYIAKTQSMRNTIYIIDVMFLCAWEFEKR